MKLTILSMALAGSLLCAGQAMATDLLQDDELDRMSAAGDPVVIKSEATSGPSTVTYLEDSHFELNLPADTQIGLRALTIQNVVGELQLLVNLNVLSARTSVTGTDQRNFSLQSWGSTLPDADTIKAVDGVSAPATCGATDSCSGGTAKSFPSLTTATVTGGTATGGTVTGGTGCCGGGGCCSTCCGSGGSATGGNAQADATLSGDANANGPTVNGIVKSNASTSPGVVGGTLGSASGDVIVVSKGASSSTVVFDNQGSYTFNPATGAQRDLSALFISNVVGRAQMALNLNIASAELNLVPGANPFAQPIDNTTAVIKQVNTGMQFRGTPLPGSSGTTGQFNVGATHLNQ
jgi:hypothetical protein